MGKAFVMCDSHLAIKQIRTKINDVLIISFVKNLYNPNSMGKRHSQNKCFTSPIWYFVRPKIFTIDNLTFVLCLTD